MLVLTRKVGESVIISETVHCTVTGYQNGEVRLAFDAPKSIVIHRDEVQRQIIRDRRKENWHQNTEPKEPVVDRLINTFKQGATPA